MKRTNILWIILSLIFLIIFNALFFVLGGSEHKASVWMSYGFIHFAYLLLLITPRLIRVGKSGAVLGFSLYSISTAYFLAQFFIGIVFIVITLDSINIPFLVQLCLAGLYGIFLIAHLIANERTAEAEAERQHQASHIKGSAIRIKDVEDKVRDKVAKKRVEKLYDALKSSPVKSHPELAQMEYHIIQSIGELERAAYDGNKDTVISLVESLISAVNERNVRLRALN